ncbi:hypothetical protein ACIRF8_05040 [Streptomyces sp. NPDC102406]|uniref:hypothetical protein n=1 Tax=Streptomyces sp. NPDC102406 TaxID=3366171 RepID=UPI00381FB3F9
MSDLKTLYQAAGGGSSLNYTILVREAAGSGYTVGKSSLTAWMNTDPSKAYPPTEERHVEYVLKKLIPDLQARAVRRSPCFASIQEGPWAARLGAAQRGSQSGQGGRGSRVGAASKGRLLCGASQVLLDVLPVDFVGREEELDSLEHFVTAPQGSPNYLWWQAGPWAGKTALLSWFAARCRPAGVDVAHYFIAGRLGTDRRDGFVRTVSNQLAAAAEGKRHPPIDLQQPNLGPLYEAAAQACAARHRRLILIVDGLDEDADAGSDSAGIAGLLPKDPPAGMRVIVAGRPHPHVPQKLATDHPLRDPAVVRPLADSPAARIIRDAALTELRTLLTDPVGQHLLGLLVTARGALTGADLAELAEVTPLEVRDKLSGVTGRSLAPTRTDLLSLDVRTEAEADAGRQTFVLAHQELHVAAYEALGRPFRAGCVTALHNWARQFEDEGWPEDTPNYLLTGYARLLQAEGDTERLTALALDARRQLLLVERAGADVALRHLDWAASAQPNPALALGTTAALAASRDMLLPHVRPLAPAVAQTIARLGDAPRARALTSAAGLAADKALNLAGVARVLHTTGDTQAAVTAREAATWAQHALREAGRFGADVDEAEGAAGHAALALLETALANDGGTREGSMPRRRPAEYWNEPAAPGRAAREDRERQALLEEGLALLRYTRGTGTARLEAWAQAARLLAADHPERAAELLNTLEEQAEDLACEEPTETDAAICAIQLWHTAAGAAPDRAGRLTDRILAHAHEVFTDAPTLENVSALALAARYAARLRPEPAARLVSTACRHLEHVLGPTAAPLTPSDAFHLEVGFPHTPALLAEALHAVGAPPEQSTRVRHLADRHLPAEPHEHAEHPTPAGERYPAEAIELTEEAYRLAETARGDEAEQRLEQALALMPASIPGGGRSPLWLPDLAAALVRTDPDTNTQPLTDLAQHPTDRARIHAALALAYSDTHQPALARRHAHQAAHAATNSPNWPHAAQALAGAGEAQAAIRLIGQHPRSRGAAARAAWRTTDRAARITVATELAPHAPEQAETLLLPLLERLHAASRTIRSTGLLSSLAELLPAADHLPTAPRQLLETLLEQARDQTSRHSPHSWLPEDVLVHALLRLKAGDHPDLQLTWLTRDLASRGPEHFPTPALAVLHATLGDPHTALHTAQQPTNPLQRALALTAVAAHHARLPLRPHPTTDPTGHSHYTRAIQHLAHTATTLPPDHQAAAQALHHVLTSPAWHHAIHPLHKLSPETLTTIRNITITHLHTPPTQPN